VSNPLLEYSRTLLDLVGGAIEERGEEVVDVLLPASVGEALDLPGEATLAFGSRVPPGAIRLGLESDWLARSARLLGDRGTRIEVTLPARSSPRIDPKALLESQLELANATWRLVELRPAVTRYVFLTVRYRAISNDRRDGLLTVGLNVGTGAQIDEGFEPLRLAAERALGSPPSSVPGGPPPPAPDAAALQRLLEVAAAPRARLALSPFVAGLERRLARDAERLLGYHQRLLDELRDGHERAARGRSGAELPDPRARAQAIGRELGARMDELAQSFALELEVTPIRALDVVCPVQRIEIDVLRRKSRRRIAMDYCDEARRLEPPPCEDGWAANRRRFACDAKVHLVSEAGLSPCGSCGTTYCRACHPSACPRCKALGPEG
jgi:hypothetical protein